MGCYVEIKNLNLNQPKLGPKPIPCAFLGYEGRTYRFLDINVGTIIIFRDVDFFENIKISESRDQIKEIENQI